MAGLKIENVTKSFGDVHVIRGVDLDINDGEFIVFVGPSGCGKSTLLRLVSGLEEVTSGKIEIGDVDVTNVDASERGIAMVFQSYALYPHMTVAENMGFGLKMNGVDKAEINRRVDEAARILKLTPLLDRKPKAMSGGQRQRVAIGRSIVRNPKVFLFDEPLSNLDAELRVEMRLEIAKLHQGIGNTMIYVTHDQVEAMTLADRIVVLRGGIVEQFGSPLELYDNPDNEFVAGFIGSPKMNFLKGKVGGKNGASVSVELTGQAASIDMPLTGSLPEPGMPVTLGIRPEHLEFGDKAGASLNPKADVIEHLGGLSYIYAESESGEPIVVEEKGYSSAKPGENVQISIPPERAFLFSENGARMR